MMIRLKIIFTMVIMMMALPLILVWLANLIYLKKNWVTILGEIKLYF